MVEIFREARRVLRDDGTLWLNLGDSYGSGPGRNDTDRAGSNGFTGSEGKYGGEKIGKSNATISTNLKPKNLIGIPWRVAFALQRDGWYLRCDIIWSKPNPMPESVKDRPTKAHEYIFLMSKNQRYYYDADAIKEPFSESTIGRINQDTFDSQSGGPKDGINPNRSCRRALENLKRKQDQLGHRRYVGFNDRFDENPQSGGANKRSVWTVPTQPFPDAHFAVFPPKLIEPCILAGCPEGGIVLDPFCGSGTTCYVAKEFKRDFIGIDLNPQYLQMAEQRTAQGVL